MVTYIRSNIQQMCFCVLPRFDRAEGGPLVDVCSRFIIAVGQVFVDFDPKAAFFEFFPCSNVPEVQVRPCCTW